MELELKCTCGATSKISQPNNSVYSPDGWNANIDGDIRVVGYRDKLFFECKKCGKKLWIYG